MHYKTHPKDEETQDLQSRAPYHITIEWQSLTSAEASLPVTYSSSCELSLILQNPTQMPSSLRTLFQEELVIFLCSQVSLVTLCDGSGWKDLKCLV